MPFDADTQDLTPIAETRQSLLTDEIAPPVQRINFLAIHDANQKRHDAMATPKKSTREIWIARLVAAEPDIRDRMYREIFALREAGAEPKKSPETLFWDREIKRAKYRLKAEREGREVRDYFNRSHMTPEEKAIDETEQSKMRKQKQRRREQEEAELDLINRLLSDLDVSAETPERKVTVEPSNVIPFPTARKAAA
jgi:hypothetical protein